MEHKSFFKVDKQSTEVEKAQKDALKRSLGKLTMEWVVQPAKTKKNAKPYTSLSLMQSAITKTQAMCKVSLCVCRLRQLRRRHRRHLHERRERAEPYPLAGRSRRMAGESSGGP